MDNSYNKRKFKRRLKKRSYVFIFMLLLILIGGISSLSMLEKRSNEVLVHAGKSVKVMTNENNTLTHQVQIAKHERAEAAILQLSNLKMHNALRFTHVNSRAHTHENSHENTHVSTHYSTQQNTQATTQGVIDAGTYTDIGAELNPDLYVDIGADVNPALNPKLNIASKNGSISQTFAHANDNEDALTLRIAQWEHAFLTDMNRR